jgi:hypothetical protein
MQMLVHLELSSFLHALAPRFVMKCKKFKMDGYGYSVGKLFVKILEHSILTLN